LSYLFISHVEEDAEVAKEISISLEKLGYRTGHFNCDIALGEDYLLMIRQIIKQSQVIIHIISPNSLLSRRVLSEVALSNQARKPLFLVLKGITYAELQQSPHIWIVSKPVSYIVVPLQGLAAIVPRIVSELKSLRIEKI
jgi:hypothetical protein